MQPLQDILSSMKFRWLPMRAFGSIDANRGDYQNGWDTDQFPINIYELVETMLVIIEQADLKQGV
jgi:xylose isomerase